MFDLDGAFASADTPTYKLREAYEMQPDNYSAHPYAKEIDLMMAASSQMQVLNRPAETLDKLPEVFITFGKMDPVIPEKQGQRLMDAFMKRERSALYITDSLGIHGKLNDYVELSVFHFMRDKLELSAEVIKESSDRGSSGGGCSSFSITSFFLVIVFLGVFRGAGLSRS